MESAIMELELNEMSVNLVLYAKLKTIAGTMLNSRNHLISAGNAKSLPTWQLR